MTAIAPWFGAKRNLAQSIVAEIGPHSGFFSLFCGGCSVELVKPYSPMETINDLHGDLINLARCIKDPIAGPQLYRRLRRTLAHETLFREAAKELRERANVPAPEETDLDRAANYFLCVWLGMNGVAGTASNNHGFCRRFTANGGHAGTRWNSVVETIPAFTRRMRHWMILNADGIELAEKIDDDDGMVIYADPPYLVKGAKYVHDFTEADHERLAKALNRFDRTRVIVSYYDHPLLDDLYPGWTKRTFEVSKSMVSSGKRDANNKVKATEVLLINGPSLVESGELFA